MNSEIKIINPTVAMVSCVSVCAVVGLVLYLSPSKKPQVLEAQKISDRISASDAFKNAIDAITPKDPCESQDASDFWYKRYYQNPDFTAERNREVFIDTMKSWDQDCKKTSLSKSCSATSCDDFITESIILSYPKKEQDALRKIYKPLIKAQEQRDKAQLAELEKENARLEAESKAAMAKLEARKQMCSARNVINVCCTKACNGDTTLSSCLQSFVYKGCLGVESMVVSCSCGD